ncbi:MAG: hypothetical protein IJR07_04865 [Bacteroidaceae bacterium]|nr:hypothetical protein [Bacteroidaceae bacterium]
MDCSLLGNCLFPTEELGVSNKGTLFCCAYDPLLRTARFILPPRSCSLTASGRFIMRPDAA